MNTKKEKPVHTVRIGSIRASIWANKTKFGERHNVTFSRLYVADEDASAGTKSWRSTSSFSRDDIPVLQKVADQVFTWMLAEAARDTVDE